MEAVRPLPARMPVSRLPEVSPAAAPPSPQPVASSEASAARPAAAAKLSTEQAQALLAMRAIMQFETDPKVASQAMRALLAGVPVFDGTSETLGHALFSNAWLTTVPETRALRFVDADRKLRVDVTPEGHALRVDVAFPERQETYSQTFSVADLSRLGPRGIRSAAQRLARHPEFHAWKHLRELDGKLPAVPLPSRILAADAYDKLLADGVLDIAIAYGYLDDGPTDEPLDKEQAEELRHKLLKEHGFVASKDDPWVLEKPFKHRGKDVTCRVSIAYSAVPGKAADDPVQVAQSLKARDVFMGGLKKADVVMYDGHSRLGRGPDFTEPHELSSPGNIKIGPMVPYYVELGSAMLRFVVPFSGGHDFERPVFAKDKYQILVMDSCRSEAYYRERITRDAAEYSGKDPSSLDLVTTDTDSMTSDSIPTKLRIILGLMAEKTAPEIAHDLNDGTETRYNTSGLFVASDAETPFDDAVKKRRTRGQGARIVSTLRRKARALA